MHKILLYLLVFAATLNQLSSTFYDVSVNRNFKKASELFRNQMNTKSEKSNANHINVLIENFDIGSDLDKFNFDLNKIASDALKKLDEYIKFGEDQKLVDVIAKADEDDMDGVVAEK